MRIEQGEKKKIFSFLKSCSSVFDNLAFDRILIGLGTVVFRRFQDFKYEPEREKSLSLASLGVCEQQRSRPACASAQFDQRLCYSIRLFRNISNLPTREFLIL